MVCSTRRTKGKCMSLLDLFHKTHHIDEGVKSFDEKGIKSIIHNIIDNESIYNRDGMQEKFVELEEIAEEDKLDFEFDKIYNESMEVILDKIDKDNFDESKAKVINDLRVIYNKYKLSEDKIENMLLHNKINEKICDEIFKITEEKIDKSLIPIPDWYTLIAPNELIYEITNDKSKVEINELIENSFAIEMCSKEIIGDMWDYFYFNVVFNIIDPPSDRDHAKINIHKIEIDNSGTTIKDFYKEYYNEHEFLEMVYTFLCNAIENKNIFSIFEINLDSETRKKVISNECVFLIDLKNRL